MLTTTRSQPSEVRATTGDGAPRISGVAAPFDAWADLGAVQERIAPGAFKKALASRADIIALKDHQPAQLLGRRANKSLTLSESARGLEFDLDLPDTTLGRDVHAMAREGLLGGVSIGFDMAASTAEVLHDKRTLRQVALREISIVSAFPAYQQTSVAARTLDKWREWVLTVS